MESGAGQPHFFLTAQAFVRSYAFAFSWPDHTLLYVPYGANRAIQCSLKWKADVLLNQRKVHSGLGVLCWPSRQRSSSGATRLFWSRYIMSPIKVVSNESRCSQCRPQKWGRATQSKVRLRHAGTRSVTPKQHVHEEQIGPPVSWLHADSVGIIAGASWFGSFWTNKCKGSLDATDLKHTLIDICLMLIKYIDSIIINNGVHDDDDDDALLFTYCGFIWICLQQCFIEMIE